MIILTADKQPWERKDYDADASRWLVPGDTLTTASASVVCLSDAANTALLIDSPATVSPQAVKVWVSAGTSGHRYKITLQATTQQGRQVECEMLITVFDI